MPKIVIDDMQSGYKRLIDLCLEEGRPRSPRGQPTLDVHDVMIVLNDPRYATPVGTNRKLNMALASAETTQLIAGLSDVAQLTSIAPVFECFTVDARQPGAYGPRIADQMPQVVRTLANDSDSRQADAVIWRPDDLTWDSPDVPCTTFLAFDIYANKLDMHVHMRSNDVWLGVPYDFTMFTRLQQTLAWALGVPMGTYTHIATSFHLYDRDQGQAVFIAENPEPILSPVPAFTRTLQDTRPGLRNAEQALARWNHARSWARHAMLRDAKISLPTGPTWHQDKLREHRSGGLLCGICHYVLPRTDEFFHAHHLDNDWLGTCKRCVSARYKRRDPEKSLAARCARYGVTPEWYRTREHEQGGNCAICENPPDNGRWKDLVIDHDHFTGKARGLICSRCNHAIGLMDDDEARLERMATYLRKSREEDEL